MDEEGAMPESLFRLYHATQFGSFVRFMWTSSTRETAQPRRLSSNHWNDLIEPILELEIPIQLLRDKKNRVTEIRVFNPLDQPHSLLLRIVPEHAPDANAWDAALAYLGASTPIPPSSTRMMRATSPASDIPTTKKASGG